MTKTKLAYINYHNTAPYSYALRHLLTNDLLDIYTEVPSACARLFADQSVDIALVPVGALSSLSNFNILPDFSISCLGAVRTVCLFSNVPLGRIDTIFLDDHSRSSNLLTRVLAKEYWKIKPSYSTALSAFDENKLHAKVAIGDKVFGIENSFAYKWDLGQEWYDYNGLPFVFAVWVYRDGVETHLIQSLQGIFQQSLEDPSKWLPEEGNYQIRSYLQENIEFDFSAEKQKSLKVFFEASSAL